MPNMVYNVGMIKTYTLMDPKPNYKYGDKVKVDMAHLGATEMGVLTGRVVGKGSVHIIDYWLIEFDSDFGPTYPYKVFSVPHVAILVN
jgi:hypothetical protein